MSNQLVGIETRNKKKAKSIGLEIPEKKFVNRTPINGDNADQNSTKEDDYRKHPNKKVKTENNSENKIVISSPLRSSSKNFIKESLALLKQLASDNDTYDHIQDDIDVLQPAVEYKYKSRKVVFTKDLFQRKLKNNVTPAIFTKKNLQIRLNRPQTPMQLAFENYLNLIAQLYYKATHQLTEIYSIIEPTPVSASGEEQKPVIQLRRGRKPGRKAKRRVNWRVQKDSEPNTDNNTPFATTEVEEEEEEKQSEDPEVKNLNEIPAGVVVETIDSLVSPLKVDYVFEKWTPKEIAMFEAGLCKYGKEFAFIQFLIKTKSIEDVVEFYFAWKSTNHYKIWKHHKTAENKTNYNSWL